MNKQRIRDQLQCFRTEAELQAWFDPLQLRFSETGSVEISFPHELFARWFTKERQKEFERDMTHVIGKPIKFVYAKAGPGRVAHGARAGKPLPVAALPGFAEKYSFDSFIYNRKNEFPVSMARDLALSARSPAYIPFIICGKESCGKSHLLRATAVVMSASFPWETMFFGTVAELAARFANQESSGSFRRKLSLCNAVFIDNIQELARYPGLEEELVIVADLFRERNKPLVLAMGEPANHEPFSQKFRSRLESGLSVTVTDPDLDVRLRYAKAQCAAARLHLRKELLLPLAQRFRNLRAIQGVVAKISAFQAKTGKPLSRTDMEKILAHEPLSGRPATPAAVIALVAEAFSLSPEDISGNGRTADVVLARQAAMYLCRDLMGISSSALGRYFNGKNHATVLYACKKIKKILDSDKDMHTMITTIRKKFLAADS